MSATRLPPPQLAGCSAWMRTTSARRLQNTSRTAAGSSFTKNGFTIYEDCYNASPDSMQAALRVLGAQHGRRFAVLGSMLELGEHAAEGHRQAGFAAAKNADALYLFGGNAADMAAGAREGGMAEEQIRMFDTHEAMADALKAAAQPGDALPSRAAAACAWRMY